MKRPLPVYKGFGKLKTQKLSYCKLKLHKVIFECDRIIVGFEKEKGRNQWI